MKAHEVQDMTRAAGPPDGRTRARLLFSRCGIPFAWTNDATSGKTHAGRKRTQEPVSSEVVTIFETLQAKLQLELLLEAALTSLQCLAPQAPFLFAKIAALRPSVAAEFRTRSRAVGIEKDACSRHTPRPAGCPRSS